MLALLLCAPSADAVAPSARPSTAANADGGWANLTVVGGVAGLLTAASLDPARSRATAFLDVIRVIHEVKPGLSPAVDSRRIAVFSYLDTLDEFLTARASLPTGPLQLSAAADGSTRNSLKRLATAIGASLERRQNADVLALTNGETARQRRAWLKVGGIDVETVARELNAGHPVRLDLESDAVPLPLPAAAWRSPSGANPARLARSILQDRSAALLYFGLCSMDEETRRYMGANPQLVGHILGSDRAVLFALHAGSLHVRDGRVEPPGGARAAALWEPVVGERVAQPDRFILEVLAKDEGRLAHLYDAVDRMDQAGQAFALGWWMPDASVRAERFQALFAVCAASLGGWNPLARPFSRAVYDPAHILLVTEVRADGRPGALGWRTFWQKAFESEKLPEQAAQELKDHEKGGPLDAASLLQVVGLISNRAHREMCEAWFLGQRLFATTPKERLPEVLVTIRGYFRYAGVVLTLERLGVSDPTVFASAVRRAQRIADIRDSDRVALALALHQGALVLIERARLARTLDVNAATKLLASLDALPLSDDGEFLGAVAAWIDRDYLPAIGGGAGSDAESQVVAAFAGRRQDSAPPERIIEYEGMRYRVDPSSGELERIKTVRERQGGASLEEVLAFAREVRRLAAGIPDVAEVANRVEALKTAGGAILKAQPRPSSGWSRPANLADALDDAVHTLSGIRKPQDLRKAERVAATLQHASDWELGRVLVSLAYAAAMGDPDSTALVAADPATLHEWGIHYAEEGRRVRTEWAVPKEARDIGGRWFVEGSLLGLDIGLGAQTLRRISADAPPEAPIISDNHRRTFTETAILANARDYEDADMALLARAIARGRARVAALADDPAGLEALTADAELDGTARSLLSWAIVHEQDRVPQFFSVGALLRLGHLDRAAIHALDAWGTSGPSYDGRLRLRFPVSQPSAGLAGRWGSGVLAALVPDLSLIVAEALHERHLPAALTRWMLLVATPDYLDRVAPAHEDDWLTLAADAQRILPPRMEDYLASVTTGGALVPLRKPGGGNRD